MAKSKQISTRSLYTKTSFVAQVFKASTTLNNNEPTSLNNNNNNTTTVAPVGTPGFPLIADLQKKMFAAQSSRDSLTAMEEDEDDIEDEQVLRNGEKDILVSSFAYISNLGREMCKDYESVSSSYLLRTPA